MTDLSTPAGEALSAYIDGDFVSDNPYPKGTAQFEEWLFAFADELEKTVIGNERTIAALEDDIKSLMEQMG